MLTREKLAFCMKGSVQHSETFGKTVSHASHKNIPRLREQSAPELPQCHQSTRRVQDRFSPKWKSQRIRLCQNIPL